ncbi:MAG: hypothetical protein II892_00985 [Fibrobacter sp.]|jgi:hypothetical protein|nr:hypothetical protein [Fibrobacter sp.]
MKRLPGILFLLCTPLSVWLYLKVAAASGSEILALLAAVGLYVLAAVCIAFVFNRRADLNGQSNQKRDKKHTET